MFHTIELTVWYRWYITYAPVSVAMQITLRPVNFGQFSRTHDLQAEKQPPQFAVGKVPSGSRGVRHKKVSSEDT